MTDHAKTQLRRKRKLLVERRRKTRLLLLALVLISGSGAFLFHKDRLPAVGDIMSWLRQNNTHEVLASTPTVIRGDIYDRNFRTLAATYKTYAIYARPLEIDNPDSSAEILAEKLGLEKSKLLANLKSERGFIWVAKGLDQETANAIEQSDIKGIYQIVEAKRFYPNANKAAHVVGFVEDDQGLDGIEFRYNALLRGDEISSEEIKTLNLAPGAELQGVSTHLVVNLDLMIQSKIEHFLDKRIKITGASSGSVILMDANTGAVLALASAPSFNPNRYWEFSSSALSNHALSEPVYPGDLSFIFQQAAAFNLKNEKESDPSETSEETNPVVFIVPEKIKRRKLSSAPVVDDVDLLYFTRFTQSLGFDQKPLTDLSLKDETAPSSSIALNDPSYNSSALRLLTGFTALMNGGRMVTPHLLHQAYQKGSPTPVAITLNESEQLSVLHPGTTKDLTEFLAAKWLKLSRHGRKIDVPMFFETHRFTTRTMPVSYQESAAEANNETELTPYLAQSVMLGAIPGENPRLTMVVVLSYPDSSDDIYPDALEAFGNKLSILNPDQDMIQKMLHVAAMPPPNPSPDFWDNVGSSFAGSLDVISDQNAPAMVAANTEKNMPDVTGKSLRAGLQVLQHFGLNIKLVGSGMIVSQHPPPGAKLNNGSQCTLEMQREI